VCLSVIRNAVDTSIVCSRLDLVSCSLGQTSVLGLELASRLGILGSNHGWNCTFINALCCAPFWPLHNDVEKEIFYSFCCHDSTSRNTQLLHCIDCVQVTSEAWCLYDSMADYAGFTSSCKVNDIGIEFLLIPYESIPGWVTNRNHNGWFCVLCTQHNAGWTLCLVCCHVRCPASPEFEHESCQCRWHSWRALVNFQSDALGWQSSMET